MDNETICIFVWLVFLTVVPISAFLVRWTISPLFRAYARLYARYKGINTKNFKPELKVHRVVKK
jgi:hypothetical protein